MPGTTTASLLVSVVAFASVSLAAVPGKSAPAVRIEAEKGEMLPDAKGEKAGPYNKIPGTSGGSILAFFRDGKGVRYGKVPAAKWLVIAFSTDNGGKDATVQFFDGDRFHAVFPLGHDRSERSRKSSFLELSEFLADTTGAIAMFYRPGVVPRRQPKMSSGTGRR